MPKVNFTLNGKPIVVSFEPGMHFLDVLREECGIISAKNGCAPEGTCGCCAIQVDGRPRKVMIQANKNGFLYVLDRTNCTLIAASPYTRVNWATRVDLGTGRPVLTDLYKRFLAGEEIEIWPQRGTNAVPIALNPNTGLVYASSWYMPRIQKLGPPKPKPGLRRINSFRTSTNCSAAGRAAMRWTSASVNGAIAVGEGLSFAPLSVRTPPGGETSSTRKPPQPKRASGVK